MSKKNIVILFLGAILTVIIIFFRGKNGEIIGHSPIRSKTDDLKRILIASGYFEDGDIVSSEDDSKLTIFEKYDIHIKNGNYLMYIKDAKNEDIYCEVVDAVNMNYGDKKGNSLDTCHKTLEGIISLGGINVEFFDTYKILTVSSTIQPKLYKVDSSHGENDVISVDEINYDIKIETSTFTLMSLKLEEGKNAELCGNVHSPEVDEKTYIVNVFGDDKNILASKELLFSGNTDRYQSFCVVFDDIDSPIAYYSILLKKKIS